MTRRAWREATTEIPLLTEPIGAVLALRAAERPDGAALRWPVTGSVATMTYRELHDAGARVARHLLRSAAPGDRVGIWAANCVEWVVLEYACALSGTVLVPMNTAWTDHELGHAVTLTAPTVVFAGDDTRGDSLLQRARNAELTDVEPLEDLLGLADDPTRTLPDVRPDDPFLIQFTSGTTGKAKGAVLSHRAALNAGWLRCALDGADCHDTWLNPVPLHHIGGSIALVLAALSVGACYVVLSGYDPAQMLQLLGPTGATRMGGVPTMVLGLLDHPDFPHGEAKINVLTMGGAMVPPSLVRRVEESLGANVAITYGQSECPIVSTTALDDPPELKATTVGRPLPHTEVRIVNVSSGEVVDVGEVGELHVRSPLVMEGYVADDEATKAVFDEDGFLGTGDLASLDESGVLRIHGRAREVIIRGGENIYPAEVEDAVLQHAAVAGAAVIGVDDDRWGQQVAVVVQLHPGAVVCADDLAAHVRTRLAHFKVPRSWFRVDGFPMTASGKIRKVELSQMLSSGALPLLA